MTTSAAPGLPPRLTSVSAAPRTVARPPMPLCREPLRSIDHSTVWSGWENVATAVTWSDHLHEVLLIQRIPKKVAGRRRTFCHGSVYRSLWRRPAQGHTKLLPLCPLQDPLRSWRLPLLPVLLEAPCPGVCSSLPLSSVR